MEGKGKWKLLRKAHLRELAKLKRKKLCCTTLSEEDEDFVPDSIPDSEDGWQRTPLHKEVPGDAAVRQSSATRQRRCRERLRGVFSSGQALAAWLATAEPTVEALAVEMVQSAIETALSEVEEERAAAQRAAEAAMAAAAERANYAAKKEAAEASQPAAKRHVNPRECRTFGGAPCPAAQKRTATAGAMGAVPRKKRKLGGHLTLEMVTAIARISSPKQRKFRRSDIIGGENLNRIEWSAVRRDYLELRKMYALNVFIRLRKERCDAQTAFEEASKTVVTSNGKFACWQTVRKWLAIFVANGGKLQLDQRGRKQSSKSYLDDPDVKEAAVEWLQMQLRLTRAKNSSAPPLSLTIFHKWINAKRPFAG